MFHQPDLEALLLDRVEQHPLIDLHRGVEVVDIERPAHRRASGRRCASLARACRRRRRRDVHRAPGPRLRRREQHRPRPASASRMQDLGFTERWLVVDVRAGRDLQTWDGVEQVCDPARAATFMHVTGDRYRWEFQLHDGEDEAT